MGALAWAAGGARGGVMAYMSRRMAGGGARASPGLAWHICLDACLGVGLDAWLDAWLDACLGDGGICLDACLGGWVNGFVVGGTRFPFTRYIQGDRVGLGRGR